MREWLSAASAGNLVSAIAKVFAIAELRSPELTRGAGLSRLHTEKEVF